MKTTPTLIKTFTTLMVLGQMIIHTGVKAQNLIVNPGFTNGTTGWNTQCSIEINPESVYGGTSSNPVSEIDIERCLNQEVSVSAGATYDFSYKASRRQEGTPATVGVTIIISGVPSGIQYVNVNRTYTNTTWAYTTENFSFTMPINTTDTRVNITFSNYTTTGTYGTLIDDISLSVNALSSTLPVRVSAFSGTVKNNTALLTWTASDDDADGKYFVIERAAAGNPFDSIGATNINGTSYTFSDNSMPGGTSSYRLRIVQTGGSTFSRVIILSSASVPTVQVYPNPATSSIGYKLNSAARNMVNIRIYNISGAVLTISQHQLNAGVNSGSIDITSLHPGSFFLKISDEKGMNYIQGFCKR